MNSRWSRLPRRALERVRVDPSERSALVFLGLLSSAITAMAVVRDAELYTVQLLPVYLSSIWLGPRRLAWFAVWMVGNFLAMLVGLPIEGWETVLRFLAVFSITAFVLRGAILRDRLGVTGRTGERLLVDLRDRILRQSPLPEVPAGWSLDSRMQAAGNTQFSGDFVLGHLSGNGRWLDLVVVDVSGKGVGAGSRSLVLNGAMGALLTGLPGPNFLDVVNEFLVDQGWDEGFATAVHAHVDLLEGDYWITSAGHPPSVHLPVGLGHWSKLQPPGPVLGLLPDIEYDSVQGRLDRGDVLMLYTDGMVEDRTLEIDEGISAMVTRTVEVLREDRTAPTTRIMDGLARARAGDDCALVVLQRV
ncbi:serine/threonine-protein phosphatase [Nocardioidaceae bacterium]|nr:serine/threonine-protein phosphatase [Nocardioidaceae bacterium]